MGSNVAIVQLINDTLKKIFNSICSRNNFFSPLLINKQRYNRREILIPFVGKASSISGALANHYSEFYHIQLFLTN